MTVSLEKKLEEATIAKKRYRSLFILALVSFLGVVGIVYNNTVLDYAVLDNVGIDREEGTNKVHFEYDVVKPGRIDFNYGTAVLTDRKTVQENESFQWTWDAQGPTEIGVRSRKWLLPRWDKKEFDF